MKHLLTTLMVVALAASLVHSQTMDRSPSPSPKSFPATQSPNAQFDLQFDYDANVVTGAAGNAGAAFIGTEFWTSRWASNVFHRWNPNGTLIEQFTIAGVTGVRGLAYDGQFLYGSSNTATIFKIDPVTKTLVSTITCQGGVTTRMIAYDPIRDGFWTSNFTGNISCISRTGAVIATITSTLAAKYGAAYDSYTAGGPFLWVWDQTNTTGGIPQPIYQVNLNTLTFTGFQFDILSRVTTGGTIPIAGGLFITTGLVPGKATIGGLLQGVPDRLWGLELATTAADTVLPFALQSPAAGTRITTLPGSATPVVISWDTNRVGVTFKWIFGSPTVPPRLITLPSGTNTITTTLGALDALLAAAGVAQGDSLIGQWDVWAFRNNAPANDSLKSTNGPRAITLKRGVPALIPFSLVSPTAGTRIVTSAFNSSQVAFLWRKSGDGVTYKWKFAFPTFPGTVMFNLASNNAGVDTTFTRVNSTLDGMLAAAGLAPGDSVVGQWRAYAYQGTTDSLASTQTFALTLKRQSAGDVLVAYDSASIACRTSRDSVLAVLNTLGVTYDLFNRGTQTSTLFFSLRSYKKVIWLGEATSVMSVRQKDSVKAYLNAGGTGANKAKLIIYAEDIGYQFGRTASTYYDLDFVNNYLGWIWVLDRPASGALQGLIGVLINTGAADSTVGTWPDVLSSFNPGITNDLYRFRGDGTINAIGRRGTNSNVATFGVDLESLRPAIDSPPGVSPARRLISGGLSWVDSAGITVDVRELPLGVPTTFALEQNYPNPFNPSTTIQYGLPEQSFVTLRVFNILGQEVATLVNSVQSASHFNAVWDGRNGAGQQVSTGIYFYQLEAKLVSGKNSFTSLKKMLFIK